MSKKKKVIITAFTIFTFIIGISKIVVNAEVGELDNLEMCKTETRTYYFVHNATYNNREVITKTSPTTFADELPDGAENARVYVKNKRPMGESDFQSYINLIRTGDCTISATGAPMCKQGNLRSNSGTADAGYAGYPEIFNGSMSVSEFWNTRILIPQNVAVSCSNPVNGLVSCTITRTWDSSTFSGQNYYVPAVADIYIEYYAENCGEDDDVPNEEVCNDTPSKNVPGNLHCQDGVYEEVKVQNVTANRVITSGAEHDYYTTYRDDKKSCTTELTEVITGTSTIKQEGYATFPFSPESIYSGGGFNFGASYNAKATYSVCNPLNIKVTEYYPIYTCPVKDTIVNEYGNLKEELTYSQGVLNNVNKTCTYQENKNVTFIFDRNSYELNPESYINGLCYGSYVGFNYNGNSNLAYCSAGYTPGFVNGVEVYLISQTAYYNNPDYYSRICFGATPYNEDPNLMWCIPNFNPRQITAPAIHEDGNCATETTNYSCSSGNRPYDCSDNSNEMDAYAKEMARYLKSPNLQETAEIKTKDSNKVEGSYTITDKMMDGVWNSSSINLSAWYPNQYVTYTSTFYLGKACIGLYPDSITKAPISYVGNGTCDVNTTIDGGNLYYVPLKWPNGVRFPVSVKISELSMITIMDWSLNYECGIDCYQKLYENNGDYKFVYRPIDLSKPFPGRTWGSNWDVFMSDESAKTQKLSRNSLEYSVNLTPQTIASIKNYSGYKYPDLHSVTKEGKSTLLNNWGIVNLTSNNYNKLGECLLNGNSKCWVNGETVAWW